ncbi:MAG: hypothetical protein ACXVJZ_16180 [Acidimicrobiia bacterium]
MTSSADDARAAMAEAAAAITAGVARGAGPWVVRSVERILDAWDRVPADERAAVHERAAHAGAAASARVVAALDELFATDPRRQRMTPLEVVRSIVDEPTALLRELGIPGVVRDPFDERVRPDDDYDLTPRSLADLGDEDLAAQLLVWGVAKARLLRESGENGHHVAQ